MKKFSKPGKQAENALRELSMNLEDLTYEELRNLIHTFQARQIELEQQVKVYQAELACVHAQIAQKTEETARITGELYRHKQEFSIFAEHSPDIIARFDRELRHLYVNPAIETATGISSQTFIGKTHHELGLSGEIYSHWEQSCFDVFETGKEVVTEFDLPTPEGTRWYHGRVVPEFAEDNSVATVLSIAHDITERKRAEETLRIYQKYLKNLVEQRTKELVQRNAELKHEIEERRRVEERLRFTEFSVERSAVATVWLGADGKIFRVNEAACWLLGYSREELVSMSVHDFKSYVSLSRDAWENFWQHLRKHHHFELEFNYRTEEGELCFFEITTNYFEYDGKEYCLSFVRDITERKQAETDLQKAKEAAEEALRAAEDANQAKSVFLANMSHEFRTPLNGILGYTQLLKRDQRLTKEQREIVETMHISGEHLLMIINDVLDISKIEAKKMELEPGKFHLPAFLENIMAICRIRAQQQKISFDYEMSTDVPTGVLGDEKRLRQILLNLLGNAIKFTREGRVVLRVMVRSDRFSDTSSPAASQEGNTHPSPSQEGIRSAEALTTNLITNIRFEVEDTGTGIPPEQLEDIFLPFHQAEDRRLVHTEGTGLGLAICQRLVHMMDSKLHVKSTVGQGSTFWFDVELPEVEGDGLPIQLEGWQNIIGFKGETRTVLIVDDKEKNRGLLKDMLLPLGFEVVEATDGHDALNKADECHPDIIFMDLIMPVMNGFEATKRIRQNSALKDTIVIAVSASVFDQTQEKSTVAGCDDFLAKPVQLNDLLEKLQIHLKLEWIYEGKEELCEPKGSSEQAAIVPPVQEDLTMLLNLAMMGDIIGIQEYATALETRDLALAPFGNKLRQLAKDFFVEEIQEFLRQYMEGE